MKPNLNITKLFTVLLLVPIFALAQVDFNKKPDDDKICNKLSTLQYKFNSLFRRLKAML